MNRYAFDFSWESTYGLAAKLLDDSSEPGIVLDLGCGEGTFATPVRELGREYLGVELDEGSVARCREAGLDVHHVDLAADFDDVIEHLVALVAGRRVAAIALLDVVEHLQAPPQVFANLARLVDRLDGPTLVLSIPNVTHIDLGVKLLLARWDVTRTGLLDDTHVSFFDAVHLGRYTSDAGFVEIGRSDKEMTVTEQDFPLDHPAVSRTTNLRQFAEVIRGRADDHCDTYQFVRAYRRTSDPVPRVPSPAEAWADVGSDRPFCSVVVRTQGMRTSLDDALTCLAAQTDRDVEVLVMVHSDVDAVIESVEAQVGRYAESFVACTRVIPVPDGGRAAPLNVGIEHARGRYLAFLDDDDLVTANWIEEFRRAADEGPATVLRTQCVVQDHRRTASALVAYEPVEGFSAPYNPEFDFLEHRQLNQTPICAWAAPLGGVHALRMRFDDDLPVCEDWDFLIRAASLFGVTNRTTFTSVYRRFTDGWGSTTTIHAGVWLGTSRAIRERLDRTPTLLPPGSVEHIVRLREEAAELSAVTHDALAQIEAFERSRYWRATAPLRWLTSKRGHAISRAKQRVAPVVRRVRPRRDGSPQ